MAAQEACKNMGAKLVEPKTVRSLRILGEVVGEEATWLGINDIDEEGK